MAAVLFRLAITNFLRSLIGLAKIMLIPKEENTSVMWLKKIRHIQLVS